MLHCFDCGELLPNNLVYCLQCGSKVEDGQETIVWAAPVKRNLYDDVRRFLFLCLVAGGLDMVIVFFIAALKI